MPHPWLWRLRMQALAHTTGERFAGVFLDQLDDINAGIEQSQLPASLWPPRNSSS